MRHRQQKDRDKWQSEACKACIAAKEQAKQQNIRVLRHNLSAATPTFCTLQGVAQW